MEDIMLRFKEMMRDPVTFAAHVSRTRLRSYQRGVMEAVIDSVLNDRGFSFVVMFPRQTGKNELQALIESYLITLFSHRCMEMIKVSPTLKPQAYISMRRFESVMRRNKLMSRQWKKEEGNSYRVGGARMTFLSAAPTSNIVGATASGLLEVDEAQHVSIQKFDRDVSPMSASTCATHVFWGTAWTSTTLLGRELRAAQEAEKKDGLRRVFKLSADDIYAEVPAYRKFVEEKVARQGRNHPMVRTQYFSEEIDGQGGMFPAERMEKIRGIGRTGFTSRKVEGVQPDAPTTGITALLLDVAGEDEGVRGIDGTMSMSNPTRDATALTLVEVVVDGSSEEGTGMVGLDGISKAGLERAGLEPAPTRKTLLPTYIPIKRWQWIGENHVKLQGLIREIALEWNARAVVVDATGVGAGLASFLERALPGRVTPFTFNSASKSKLGWDFLAIVDSQRWQEPELQDLPGDDQLHYQKEFFEQLTACQFEVLPGAGQQMRWGVPDGSRSPLNGEALHDDWVLSAALAAVLDKMDWRPSAPSFVVPAPDPLREMDGKY